MKQKQQNPGHQGISEKQYGFLLSLTKVVLSGAIAASVLGIGLTAFAANTPGLSVSQNGNSMTLTVSNADPNATVSLSQRQSSQYWAVISNLGTTNSSGNFSTTQPLAWDGSSNALQLYVTVDSASSATVQLTPASGNSGTLALSQTSVALTTGQTSVITASPSSGTVYVSSNTNSSAASYSVSGDQVNIYGLQSGGTTITVCSTAGQCGTIIVTVNGGSSGGTLTVSPSSLNLNVGQSSTASILNSSGTVYISSNSNTSVASVGLSGQILTVYGVNAGNTTVTLCQSNSSSCTSLTVYVVSSGATSNGGLTFATPTVQLSVGQNQDVTSINSPNGAANFYVSSNSSPSVATASIDGSLLHVSALSIGNTTVMVCQSGTSYCGSVYVTISNLTGAINFTQNSLSLSPGQNTTVTISGGSSIYSLYSNSSPSVASASLTGNVLYVTALNVGSTTLTICESGSNSSCSTVSVTVGNGSSSGSLTFSSTNPVLTLGQSQTVTIYSSNGYNSGYAVSGNSNPSVANVSVSGSALSLSAGTTGSTFLTICETGTAVCGSLTITVNNASSSAGGPVSLTQTSLPALTSGQYYSYQLQGTGGTGAYTYSITSGSLPSGLSLSSSGLISGTASVSSQINFTVLIVDTSGTGSAASVTIPVSGSSIVTPNPTPSPTPAYTSGTYVSGELINENGTISMVYKNMKTGFASASAFTGLGFSFSNVISAANSGLENSGQVINSSSGAHPWGSWILSGSTVYFVHQNGLIPIPDWNTFLNNDGLASYLVPANSADLALPQLPLMTLNDPRMK